MKDKQEKEEKEWAEKLERERARTLNKVEKYCFSWYGASLSEKGSGHFTLRLVLLSKT